MERKVSLVPEVEELEDCWMTSFFKYLIEGGLPPDKVLTKKVKLKSSQYAVQNGKLYKRSYLQPLLRYMRPVQANYIVRDFHEEDYGSDVKVRALSKKS